MSLGAYGGDQSFWVDWNESLWISACGKESVCGFVLVTKFHPWRRQCLQEWRERERVFRWVKRELR